jgi:DNA-binding MarR family transcriptional regulator
LKILENSGFIKSRREGVRYRLFYPTELEFPEIRRFILSELQITLLKIIESHDGITQKEIVDMLGESQQKISYNLKKLEKAREISSIKRKGEKHYYIPHVKKEDSFKKY